MPTGSRSWKTGPPSWSGGCSPRCPQTVRPDGATSPPRPGGARRPGDERQPHGGLPGRGTRRPADDEDLQAGEAGYGEDTTSTATNPRARRHRRARRRARGRGGRSCRRTRSRRAAGSRRRRRRRPRPGGRTEALINHGRSRARPPRSRRILQHWRMIAVGAVALLAGVIAALVAVGGGSASWPASVTTVQSQIKQACENPDVAAEPSGLNWPAARTPSRCSGCSRC